MSDYIILDDGIVIDDQGEIIESGNSDALAVIATRRADAKIQMERWKKIVADYDRVLLRKQEGKRQTYGPVVIQIGSRTFRKTNTDAFADALAVAPLEFSDIISTLAAVASNGISRSKLPESVRELFDANTEIKDSYWIESHVAEMPAPVFEHAPGWEGDDGTV